MSFLEDMGKTLGQVAVGINDAAGTIFDAAQGAAGAIADAAMTVTDAAADTIDQINQQREEESAKKCPGCGQPLNGMYAICPLCGYELSTQEVGTDSYVSNLANELKRIEETKHSFFAAISQQISTRESQQAEERAVSAIRNFVIPSSKQAIYEFMMLAAGNIDARVIAKTTREKRLLESSYEYERNTDDPAKALQLAWLSKFEQAFQKAKASIGDDADFNVIQDLYDSKMGEIEVEKEKAKSFFQRMR